MMDKKKDTIPIRIPTNIYKELDQALSKRFENKLIKRNEMKMTEALRLIGRTPEWKTAVEKLKIIPKKEDMRYANDLF